jgi:hypothetical protein
MEPGSGCDAAQMRAFGRRGKGRAPESRRAPRALPFPAKAA